MTSENVYTEIVAERGAKVIPDLLRGNAGNVGEIGALLDIAADEIERLRAELAECKRDADRAEVERLRGVLVEVMEWTERYTAPGHPISTVIRAALAKEG